MEEKKQFVAPSIFKRLIAILVDFVVCIQFFAFFQLIVASVLNANFDYQNKLVAYQDKLVEHNLGYYELDNENNTKIYIKYEVSENDQDGYITQEEYDDALASFNADTIALELSNEVTTLSTIGTSLELFLAILPNYFLFPLLFKNGQTLGKKLLKIAVVDANSRGIKFKGLFMRHFIGLYVFELLVTYLCMFFINLPFILLLSAVTLLFSKNKRSLHDFVANTYVVDMDVTVIY